MTIGLPPSPPSPNMSSTLTVNGGLGHTGLGDGGGGEARKSRLLGIQIQFAKQVNVDLQFSRKSIKQMSPKHNQIGTTVILHSSLRLGFCHFYDQFKCVFLWSCGNLQLKIKPPKYDQLTNVSE